MNKSQIISIIKSLDTTQAQLWHDHIMVYLQTYKHYPYLKYTQDQIGWFATIDPDLSKTMQTMKALGYSKLSDWRMVARMLTQYHTLIIPSIVRTPSNNTTTISDKIVDNNSIILHNITNGIDLVQGDQRYSRNLDTDLQKLLN